MVVVTRFCPSSQHPRNQRVFKYTYSLKIQNSENDSDVSILRTFNIKCKRLPFCLLITTNKSHTPPTVSVGLGVISPLQSSARKDGYRTRKTIARNPGRR